jgi:ferritin-like metal-binding protein YciE
MKIDTLLDLFTFKIMCLYDIETQIIKALPKMAKAATNEELAAAFENHLEETKAQAERLEAIFEELDVKPKKVKVEAIRGLVADTEWVIKEKPSPELLDTLLVSSARYVEHYEMAGYLSAIAWAESLGLTKALELLEETLEEEKKADALLSESQTAIIEKADEATSETEE